MFTFVLLVHYAFLKIKFNLPAPYPFTVLLKTFCFFKALTVVRFTLLNYFQKYELFTKTLSFI